MPIRWELCRAGHAWLVLAAASSAVADAAMSQRRSWRPLAKLHLIRLASRLALSSSQG